MTEKRELKSCEEVQWMPESCDVCFNHVEWRRFLAEIVDKYLPPTDCDRDAVGAVAGLLERLTSTPDLESLKGEIEGFLPDGHFIKPDLLVHITWRNRSEYRVTIHWHVADGGTHCRLFNAPTIPELIQKVEDVVKGGE